MRLATLKDGTAVVLTERGAIALAGLGLPGTILDLVRAGPAALSLARERRAGAPARPFEPSDLGAPIPRPPKVVAIGLNYVDHAAESRMELPASPLVFAKFPSSVTGPFDAVEIPSGLTAQVDFEAELGVVIGTTARRVSPERALEHVFGYTVVNDVSARDLQFGDGQWVRGKSLDSFCPTGPWILTADEVPDPQALRIGCAVNERTMQDATTADMVFGVADLVSRLSHSFRLEPGDLIATGTPPGVGFARTPPIFLQPGDRLRTWVEGIGELVNPVAELP